MTMQGKQLFRVGLMFLFAAVAGRAQTPAPAAPSQELGAPRPAGQWRITNDGPGQPLLGKITAINKGSLELARPDGTTAKVKLTDKTEYRKDRQSAKLVDFKIGDLVFVHGEENADQSVTAQMTGGRSGTEPETNRGCGGAGFEVGKE